MITQYTTGGIKPISKEIEKKLEEYAMLPGETIVECGNCDGIGRFDDQRYVVTKFFTFITRICEKCGGSGKIPITKE